MLMNNVMEVLLELGYQPKDYVKEFRMAPLYRESKNESVLVVRKDSGRWIDYAACLTGDLADLVKLSLKLTSIEEALAWLKNKNISIPVFTNTPSQKLSTPKIFDKAHLARLVDDTSYWEGRKISLDILSKFNGGLAYKGKMAGRYVFPVFNHRRDIVGFAGRDIFDNSERVKWKLLGKKEEWVYPAFLNYNKIKEDKTVIIVESIGDCLALFNAGIENVLVAFGIYICPGIVNFLIRSDIRCIIIAFNNDKSEGEGQEWGNKAAEKARSRLLSHFDEHQVEIALPDKKDFGVMTSEEIQLWMKKRVCQPVV